jgi:hypothetical protein
MKTAIIFSEGIKQINFVPETDEERMALKMITPNDDIKLAIKEGHFGEEHFKPFTVDINKCQGGYLRTFDNSEGIMLVLTPKSKEEPEIAQTP